MLFDKWPPEIDVDPYYCDKQRVIYHADCRELPLFGVSAVVTDPPYETGFMNKDWDKKGIALDPNTWQIIRGSCLPGAMLLSFGGTRTSHRIVAAVEDAGWEIRDCIMWVYGSGFPKSLDISKAIDKAKGAARERIKIPITPHSTAGKGSSNEVDERLWLTRARELGYNESASDKLSTSEAKLWEGYGTALKPAYEPIIVAMNPLDGTFANNALKHGVAGLNVDECRIPLNGDKPSAGKRTATFGTQETISGGDGSGGWSMNKQGRFPANFIHDGSQEVMELFPESKTGNIKPYISKDEGMFGMMKGKEHYNCHQGDSGSAARFFYCAKASRSERDDGLEDMPITKTISFLGEDGYRVDNRNPDGSYTIKSKPTRNNHPTVKPLALMEYLCKLVKMPEYNLILDPFCGSGTTLLVCTKLGIPCIGIDSDERSCEIAAKRCAADAVARIQKDEY